MIDSEGDGLEGCNDRRRRQMGSFINDINDVEEQITRYAHCYSRVVPPYKIPDGKPPNVFGLDERFMTRHTPWK
jgi:hypothetical protein